LSHIITVQNLSKHFEGVIALDNVNLEVEKEEIRSIIGPNGSGKTTLINVITGLVPSTDGKIHFGYDDITGLRPHLITKKGIARTFQIPKILPEMTCLKNVALGQHCKYNFDLIETLLRCPFAKSKQEDEILEKSSELLDFMGLKESSDRLASSLSWVEQQMLQLCRALSSEPKVLLLDEPTAGMGEAESKSMQEAIKKIKKMGVTIIVVAHDMRFIMEVSDIVTCLSFGKVITEGSALEVRNHPKVLEVYLGKE
jgi:branched-chain amino acid transport system ATP-binding protein